MWSQQIISDFVNVFLNWISKANLLRSADSLHEKNEELIGKDYILIVGIDVLKNIK